MYMKCIPMCSTRNLIKANKKDVCATFDCTGRGTQKPDKDNGSQKAAAMSLPSQITEHSLKRLKGKRLSLSKTSSVKEHKRADNLKGNM